MPISKQRENGENRSLLPRNLRFAKIRHLGDNFADYVCKMEGWFTDFRVAFCGLARGESCFAFEVGVGIVLQPPKESR
ncbi:hypothetical protein DWY97_05670 [Bacteroides thetaiotaomicron]|uniref:Uncharacterized protein n=1 Tax=Bacteroides fragilis (strain ATCC 25285 / DSM 2151 / CCUG 4856 / JCM 11019 / LMG 10263 / NCTC 9343 / Onslow / VPI 2553 / EN-2) TaxID=272559 RepID=Q5LGA3_BACFN|nr:hypothetical protein DXA81_09095 [Bacteroides fragilis]RGQ43887.1 hypothetical protein DWY97_05670 [Bacteroides thetaiotaomicron]RJX14365.1 hypothetical protein DXA54_04680 [Bacteroides sp. OF03-11BH]CAH06838.1 hypothetical protein BF9343_1057 [Bacteroides fragilis NCTC 9343]